MKNFTNNLKQFTSRLSARWLIMALMLLVGTSSAWGATVNGVIYFEKPNANWGTPVLCLGKGDGSQMNFTMELHCGNIYKKQVNWGEVNATCIAFTDCTGSWGWEENSLEHRLNYISGNGTYKYDINSNPAGKIFKPGTTNNPVNNGNGNLYSWDGGYAEETFSESLCCTAPAAPFGGTAQSETICAGSYTFSSDYKWYTTTSGTTTVSGTTTINENKTYYIASVATEGCESSRTQYNIKVNPIPSFSKNPTNKSICEGDSEDNLTTLSGVTVSNGSPVWYNAQTGGSKVNVADVVNGGTYWVAAENATTGCKNATRKQFVLTVNPRPEEPTFDPIPDQCGSYTLPTEDKNKVSVNWYTAATGGEKITSVTTTDTYYAEAVDGTCTSAERTLVQITIKTKPIISISGNNSAVLYEDVELIAATDGTSISWEITEGDGSLSSTTGNSVTLTSSSADNVAVTATATLGSCTATDTYEVEFSAENCADVTTTVEETVGKIKLLLSKPSWIGGSEKFYCYAWVNNTSTTLLGGWPGTELTQKEGDYYYVVVDANNKDIKIILNDRLEQTVNSDVLNANKIYQISATSSKNSDNKYTFNSKTDKGTYKESVTTTVPAPITAPAAKTISVSTTDGEGNIIFSGQVVKTGCDATNEYGFQYSSDEQTWTTVKVGENAAAGTVISNNTVTRLDGTYYVRAYITNDNSTQYGAIKEITVSTEKDPITTVTLTHVKNQAGESYSDQELENLTYCVGDIVWFKLEQDGSNFQEYKWISYPGTELRGMYTGGMFQFKITKSGDVGIRLRNDANVDGEGNPTWVESNLLEFNTHPEPTAPTIRFATATICSNDNEGATLKLGATVSGQAYELWKYENDDDTEGSKVANVATLNCTENNQELQFTGIKTAGKYFVKTYYTAFCNTVTANSSYATLTVVNAKDVSISITPATATTTPWMPVKLTISATDDYTLEVPDGVEFSQKGDICSVKIPLPQGATGGEGQYENVSFPQNATTSYTVTANLVSIGGEDNPCAVPATATITLNPYVEECTIGH